MHLSTIYCILLIFYYYNYIVCVVCVYYIYTIYLLYIIRYTYTHTWNTYTSLKTHTEFSTPHQWVHHCSLLAHSGCTHWQWLSVNEEWEEGREKLEEVRDWQRKEMKTSLSLEHTHAPAHTHMYLHTHPHAHIHTHAYMHTQAHTHTNARMHAHTHTHTLVVFPTGGPAPVSLCSAPLSTEDPLMGLQCSPQSCSHTGRQWPEVAGETAQMTLDTQKLTTQHMLPTAQKCMPPVTFSVGSHVLKLRKTFVVKTLYYCNLLCYVCETLDITTDTCYSICSSPK